MKAIIFPLSDIQYRENHKIFSDLSYMSIEFKRTGVFRKSTLNLTDPLSIKIWELIDMSTTYEDALNFINSIGNFTNALVFNNTLDDEQIMKTYKCNKNIILGIYYENQNDQVLNLIMNLDEYIFPMTLHKNPFINITTS